MSKQKNNKNIFTAIFFAFIIFFVLSGSAQTFAATSAVELDWDYVKEEFKTLGSGGILPDFLKIKDPSLKKNQSLSTFGGTLLKSELDKQNLDPALRGRIDNILNSVSVEQACRGAASLPESTQLPAEYAEYQYLFATARSLAPSVCASVGVDTKAIKPSDDPLLGIPGIVGKALNTVLGILGSVALIIFIYAGVTYMNSLTQGASEAAEQSIKIIKFAIIGIAIIFGSYVIAQYVISVFL